MSRTQEPKESDAPAEDWDQDREEAYRFVRDNYDGIVSEAAGMLLQSLEEDTSE